MSEGIQRGFVPVKEKAKLLGVDFVETPDLGIAKLNQNRPNTLEHPQAEGIADAQELLSSSEVVSLTINSFGVEAHHSQDGESNDKIVGVAHGRLRPHGFFVQRVERDEPLVDYPIHGSGWLIVQKAETKEIEVHYFDDTQDEGFRYSYERGDTLMF